MTDDQPVVDVRNDTEKSRYDAVVDGRVVGFSEYRVRGDRVVFTHTEVDPAWQGKGIAGRLIGQALDDVVASGRRITPLCPYVADYLKHHPEYEPHVARRP